jgi:hypothetical protein
VAPTARNAGAANEIGDPACITAVWIVPMARHGKEMLMAEIVTKLPEIWNSYGPAGVAVVLVVLVGWGLYRLSAQLIARGFKIEVGHKG